MFSFEYPFLALLIIIPLIIKIISAAIRQKQQTVQILYPDIKNIENAFGGFSAGFFSFSQLMSYLIYLCLVITIMRPQLTDYKVSIINKGRDIIIAADLSGSMQALDFSTANQYITRLDVAKQTTADFIKQRNGDRIGLVLFGDNAYLHVPLTLDLKSVTDMLNNTVIGMAGQSTAIGDAIGLAVQKLRNSEKNASLIILLTDGENTSGVIDPLNAARIAANYGIKIYTIGIGKSGIARMLGPGGRIFNAEVKLDEKTLKQIAKITGGKYFNAVNKNIMDQIYQEINKLEKVDNQQKQFLIKKELYQIPLSVAMIMLLFLVIKDLIKSKD